MKRTIPALALSILMTMSATAPNLAAAESALGNTEGAGTSPLQTIQEIEVKLSDSGTCVCAELSKQIEEYRALAQDAEGAEKERLLGLIEGSTALLEKYEQVTISAVDGESFVDRKDLLEAAIASVVGFFSMLGYRLSAELLTQMHNNDRLDCVYTPVNAERTLKSAFVTDLKNGRFGAGAGAFTNAGNDVQRDNYFSLHNFRYVKSPNGTIVIADRYDYSKDDTFGAIQDIPIQLMYEAQEMGLLVPYYVVIVDAPEEGAENFTSDYLALEDGTVHIYDGADDECCDICDCECTREICSHIDKRGNKLCDVCKSVLEREFQGVERPKNKFFAKVSDFFNDTFSKMSEGWNSFVASLKDFFSFSWLKSN